MLMLGVGGGFYRLVQWWGVVEGTRAIWTDGAY